MKELFYYLRDRHRKPIVTVCLIGKDGNFARGIAICSDLDNPRKKTGRNIAKGRATRALLKKTKSDPIHRDDAQSVFLDALPDQSGEFYENSKSLFIGKNRRGWFCPTLTRYEKEILDKANKITA